MQQCSAATGCDKAAVEKIITQCFRQIREELSRNREIDLGEEFGVLRCKDETEWSEGKRIFVMEDRQTGKQGPQLQQEARCREDSSMNLLEYLRVQTDCDYVSDLRGLQRLHSIANAVGGLDIRQYSLQEWNNTVGYIVDETVSFSTEEEAADYLKRIAKKKNVTETGAADRLRSAAPADS